MTIVVNIFNDLLRTAYKIIARNAFSNNNIKNANIVNEARVEPNIPDF
jgi:hypothetical protein